MPSVLASRLIPISMSDSEKAFSKPIAVTTDDRRAVSLRSDKVVASFLAPSPTRPLRRGANLPTRKADKHSLKTYPVHNWLGFARKPYCRPRAAVVIAPSLRRQSPQNGNICGRSRRLSAVGAPNSANWELGDETECAKSRYFRPFFAFFRNCSRALECLADLAGFELRHSQFANAFEISREFRTISVKFRLGDFHAYFSRMRSAET